jgi:hypothetical protein
MSEEKQMWIVNEFAGISIRMRNSDGYYNGGDMCKVKKGKTMKDYLRNQDTQDFIEELKNELGDIYPTPLTDIITTGANENRGTWVHPKLAIHLGMWVNSKFGVKVINWTYRFMQGDITLVRDIVDRHDALNNTRSEVLITTLSNQVEEYKTQLNTLETTNKSLLGVTEELKTEIKKINNLRCNYCSKVYSSPIGLTRHLKRCPDKELAEYVILLDLDRFVAYIELLNEYELEDLELELIDWESNKPKLSIESGEKYTYNIYLNSSRWKVARMLQTYFHLPFELLLSEDSFAMVMANKKYLKTLMRGLNKKDDAPLREEFKEKLGLIVESDEE